VPSRVPTRSSKRHSLAGTAWYL